MTIKEKRNALLDFCHDHTCADDSCPLHTSEFKCGRGMSWYGMSTDDVLRAYPIVFPESTSTVNHPGHYNREGAMECIDEMVLIFGKEAVKGFCVCNAWKYRYRAADKNGLEDLKKSDWYLAKYHELMGGGK